MNKLRTKKEETPAPTAPPAPSKEEVLLTEIRDILKDKHYKILDFKFLIEFLNLSI